MGRKVGVQVVPNDVDRALGVALGDLPHEGQEVRLRAMLAAGGDRSAGMHVQGGKQGLGAMPNVFKLSAAEGSRPWRTVRTLAFEDLNAWFLINRKDNRIFGRLPVEVADLIDLGTEFRIWTVQPLPGAMGMQVASLKDALVMAPADVAYHTALLGSGYQFVQGRRRPAAFLVCALAGQGDQLKPLTIGDPPWSSGPRVVLQSLLS
jgi:hypothetical protein